MFYRQHPHQIAPANHSTLTLSSCLAQIDLKNLKCKCETALAGIKQAPGNQVLNRVINGAIFLEPLNKSAYHLPKNHLSQSFPPLLTGRK